jgi:hypothetical protein
MLPDAVKNSETSPITHGTAADTSSVWCHRRTMLAHAAHTLASPNDDEDEDERSDDATEDEEADGSSACEAASGSGGASSSTLVPTQLEHSVWPQIGQRTLYGPSMPNEALTER